MYMFVFDFTWFYNLQEKEFKKFKLINMDYNLLKKQKKNAHSVIIDM